MASIADGLAGDYYPEELGSEWLWTAEVRCRAARFGAGMATVFWIVFAAMFALAILLWLGAKEHAQTRAELDAINALPVDAAEALARGLLTRPGLFQCTLASGPISGGEVPASVAELLNQYEEVLKGEFWIGRQALKETPRLAGYIKVGEDFEFTQVLARTGDARVFVAYGDQPVSEEPEIQASVWHLLIAVSGEKVGKDANVTA